MIRPGKGGYAITTCDVCVQAILPLRGPWMRVRHDFRRRDVCATCESNLVRRAEDRGHTPADWSRIIEIGRALGGEVWRVGDLLYWFREPITFPARTANVTLVGPAAAPPSGRRRARSRWLGWPRFLQRPRRSPRR